jgi:hypothetical protein
VRALLLLLLIACCIVPELRAQEVPFAASFETGDLRGREQWGEGLRAQLRRPPPSQPATLRVELTAEGETPFEPMKPIQFAARAEPWRQDLEYRYSFGDGPPTGWLRDSRFPHIYTSPGSYQVFVEVRPTRGSSAASDSVKSNVLTVQVLRKEESIPVRLEMLDSPPFQVGQSLRFAARFEQAGAKLEYQFHFGDGRSSAWTRENVARHVYAGEGTYQAVASVREQPREGRPAPSSTSSNRLMIRVVVQPGPPKPEHLVARLDASPLEVQAGEPVRLRASVEPETEGLEFTFEFGDGQESPRQAEAATEHRYTNPGAFEVLVRAHKGERMLAESRPVRITVAPRVEHRLLLEVDTRAPEVGGRVRFTWRVEPPLEGVLYLVEFGDSESTWVSQPVAEHAYVRPGEYRVLIRARIGGGEVQSNDVIVAVRAADQGPLYVLIAVVLAAAGAMVGAWRMIVRFTRRKSACADDGASTETSVVVRPHRDPGTQEVEPAAPDSEGSEVRLLPVPDRGKQAMEQGFIIRKKGGGSHE